MRISGTPPIPPVRSGDNPVSDPSFQPSWTMITDWLNGTTMPAGFRTGDLPSPVPTDTDSLAALGKTLSPFVEALSNTAWGGNGTPSAGFTALQTAVSNLANGTATDLTAIKAALTGAGIPQITNADMLSHYNTICAEPMQQNLLNIEGAGASINTNKAVTAQDFATVQFGSAIGYMFSQGCTNDQQSTLYPTTGYEGTVCSGSNPASSNISGSLNYLFEFAAYPDGSNFNTFFNMVFNASVQGGKIVPASGVGPLNQYETLSTLQAGLGDLNAAFTLLLQSTN